MLLLYHLLPMPSHVFPVNGGIPSVPKNDILSACDSKVIFRKILLAPGSHHPRLSLPFRIILLSSSLSFHIAAIITFFCALCQSFEEVFILDLAPAEKITYTLNIALPRQQFNVCFLYSLAEIIFSKGAFK
jgi:hypothetical protein